MSHSTEDETEDEFDLPFGADSLEEVELEPLDAPLDGFALEGPIPLADPQAADPEAGEYELLPPDEEVTAGQHRQAEQQTLLAKQQLQARLREPTPPVEPEMATADLPFRFGIKHLFLLMTVVAVLAMLIRLASGSFAALILTTFFGLVGAHLALNWHERRQQQAWEAKRDQLRQQYEQSHPRAELD